MRSFTLGNVRQLEATGRELVAELARQAPLLAGADVRAFVDVDSMQRRVYGYPANRRLAGPPGQITTVPTGQSTDISSGHDWPVNGDHKKQGAAFGHTKIQGKTVPVRGLNALAGRHRR